MAQKTQREGDIDADLLDLVREQLNSFVKWDLARFFHDNPYAADTAENIARFAGRDPVVVEQDLQELVKSGVLEVSTAKQVRVYRFSKDQNVRDLIQRFVIACDDPDFRVRAINQVIAGLQ